MPSIRPLAPVLFLVAATFLSDGCGDASREVESQPEPPVEALRDVPLFPLSVEVTAAGTADAIEAEFHAAAPPDSVATWYRRELLGAGWRLVGDVRASDGAITLHAQRAGPPLWVIIRPRPVGGGTEFRLIGALADSGGER